jgi:hypothetical protein
MCSKPAEPWRSIEIRVAEREKTTGWQVFVDAGRPFAIVISDLVRRMDYHPDIHGLLRERPTLEFEQDDSAQVIAKYLIRQVSALEFCQGEALEVVRQFRPEPERDQVQKPVLLPRRVVNAATVARALDGQGVLFAMLFCQPPPCPEEAKRTILLNSETSHVQMAATASSMRSVPRRIALEHRAQDRSDGRGQKLCFLVFPSLGNIVDWKDCDVTLAWSGSDSDPGAPFVRRNAPCKFMLSNEMLAESCADAQYNCIGPIVR